MLITDKIKFKILVTSICFVDETREKSFDYVVSTHKLINDIITKTNFKFRLITNVYKFFQFYENSEWSERLEIIEDNLFGEQIIIGRFNPLLKYKIFLNIPKDYDWIVFLDCDVGFYENVDCEVIYDSLEQFENLNLDFLGTRTDLTIDSELTDHENKLKLQISKTGNFSPWGDDSNLFSAKFCYYNINKDNIPDNWLNAKLPEEHFFVFKNDHRSSLLGFYLKNFCREYEKQSKGEIITIANESFEIGISAVMAGYTIGDMEIFSLDNKMKVKYNLNSIRKVR